MNLPLSDLLEWWRTEGRSFPWREDPTPYEVFISEWMLQRTRADLVLPAYQRFMARFPSFRTLSHADEQEWREVAEIVASLGRTRRVEDLRRTINEMSRLYWEIPVDPNALEEIYGVGRYTARAIAIFGGGRRLGLVDPNIVRVLERYWGVSSGKRRPWTDPRLWRFLDELLENHPQIVARDFNWALIDLGAVICRGRPECNRCPFKWRCPYARTTATK